MKKEKGITLVALIVTVVILIILAGVSLNLAFSDNGLIKKAQYAVNKSENSDENTQKKLNETKNVKKCVSKWRILDRQIRDRFN